MNKRNGMRVGIFCPELYLGGEIVYVNSIINACSRIDSIIEIVVFTKEKVSFDYKQSNISIVSYVPKFPRFKNGRLNSVRKCFICGLEKMKPANLFRKLLPVDVLIAPYVSYDLLRIGNPYIVNPQDLRHKYYRVGKPTPKTKLSTMVFDSLYRKVIVQACSIVVDSNYNKQDLVKYYNVPEGRIKIIHSLPNIMALKGLKEFEQQTYLNKYNLGDEYIYYPAHLIEAKNHLNLLDALRIIKEKYGVSILLILSGGKQTLLQRIQERANAYNLSVRYLGYIDYVDVILILKKAKALVFASLFDPYALPIWEAFYLGVPVVSSNVCALPEQVGEAGLLFDPNNTEDMAEKIYAVWTDENLRRDLIQKGYKRIKDMTFENYAKQWEKVIEVARRDSYDD
jgi:glycosyltransferase involved in cell wall biosynthesis